MGGTNEKGKKKKNTKKTKKKEKKKPKTTTKKKKKKKKTISARAPPPCSGVQSSAPGESDLQPSRKDCESTGVTGCGGAAGMSNLKGDK